MNCAEFYKYVKGNKELLKKQNLKIITIQLLLCNKLKILVFYVI